MICNTIIKPNEIHAEYVRLYGKYRPFPSDSFVAGISFAERYHKQKLQQHGVSGKLPELSTIYDIFDKHQQYQISDKTFLEMLRAAFASV